MSRGPELRTDRLLLRRWRHSDMEPFAAMNADPEVMRFLPAPLTREQSDEFADRIEARFGLDGFGLWAVEVVGGEPFVGYVGLNVPRVELPFEPCVEVGWRLAPQFWGRGIATEAADAALGFGFGVRGLPEIVSFTVPGNLRSRAVMERLGMTHDPADDFEHPSVPPGNALRAHVLYRLSASEYARAHHEQARDEGGKTR